MGADPEDPPPGGSGKRVGAGGVSPDAFAGAGSWMRGAIGGATPSTRLRDTGRTCSMS